MTSFEPEDEAEIFTRFETETAGIHEPAAAEPIGEVIPPGEEPEEEDEQFVFPVGEFITEELVGGLFAMPGNAMARKTGEEWWRPEQDEVDLLGRGIAPPVRYLVEKWLGKNSGPYAVIAGVLGAVYGPRMVRELRRSPTQPKTPDPRRTSQRESASSSANGDAASPQSSSDFSTLADES